LFGLVDDFDPVEEMWVSLSSWLLCLWFCYIVL